MAKYSGKDNKLGHLVQKFDEEAIDSLEELRIKAKDIVSEIKIKSGDRESFTPARTEALARQASNSDTKEEEINRFVNKMSALFKDPANRELTDDQLDEKLKANMKEELYSFWDKVDATKSPAETQLTYDQAMEKLEALLSKIEEVTNKTVQNQQQIDGNLNPCDSAVNAEERTYWTDMAVNAAKNLGNEILAMITEKLMQTFTTIMDNIVWLSGKLKNLLSGAWDYLRWIIQMGKLWVMENWKIIAAAIFIVLLILAMVYWGPALLDLATAMIENVADWITLALKKVIARSSCVERVSTELALTDLQRVQAFLPTYWHPLLHNITPSIYAEEMPLQKLGYMNELDKVRNNELLKQMECLMYGITGIRIDNLTDIRFLHSSSLKKFWKLG